MDTYNDFGYSESGYNESGYNGFGSQSHWESVYSLGINRDTWIPEDTLDGREFYESTDQTPSTTVHYDETVLLSTREGISVAAKPDTTELQSGGSNSSISDIMNTAEKWVWNGLKDFLPGLYDPGNRMSSRAMKASLISLGFTTRVRDHRWLNFAQRSNRWAQRCVEMASKTEPVTTATIIALYSLAIIEMITYDSWNNMQKARSI
ncbi:uncharacterized protein BDV17DRAFT_295502 [Aspergillus undulatus]|uniref:uncharacterized protein n=1 Tax=Aspergillus undulatus TaxID=1810928 RepID=UPI003CCE05A0